jgi:hypothetical protein
MSVRASAARARGPECTMECTCARRGDRSHRTPHRSRVSSPIRRCQEPGTRPKRVARVLCTRGPGRILPQERNNRTNKPQHGRLNMAVGAAVFRNLSICSVRSRHVRPRNAQPTCAPFL